MSTLLEVLVTCDSNNTLWTSCVWDPHTGTSLMTYKGGGTAESRTLAFIGNDYLAAVEKTKPVLHIWPLNSHQTVQGIRFILPGKTNALAITRDGSYIIAGIDEKIYLWQLASGNLLTIINRHYQKIILLKFTADGKYFVSAAEDGMVMVWALSTVAANPEIDLVVQTSAGQHDPVYIFSDHSLPVTDLCLSKTGMHGRLCTVSNDRTCKIYDLASGEMLLNLLFDVPLTSITMDVLELNVFIGTIEGTIHQLSLINPPRNRDQLVNENLSTIFQSHTKVITCLSVSLDGETLMSGSGDEQVILWHIPSKQPIRTLRHKGPITNAFFTLNYPNIYKQDYSPNIILHSLERTLEKDTDEVTELDIIINKKIDFWNKSENYVEYADYNVNDPDDKSKDQVNKEIETLKAINANLYSFCINKALDSIPVANKPKKRSNTKVN